MLPGGRHSLVPVDRIELDRSNPRIARFLEMYSCPTPEQLWFALQGDDDVGSDGTTFSKLKNSILTMRGIIQPVILRAEDDGFVCIEGNTRVALYQDFKRNEIKGAWEQIPAIIYDEIDQQGIEAIRLQAHLVGPRAWDPYSKAKHLHYLRTEAHFEWARLIDFCGGREREVKELIGAYEDMERYYRPVLPDDTAFDTTRFSGFREVQRPSIKQAILEARFDLSDFAEWIRDNRLTPLQKVRRLPAILRHPRARKVFLASNAVEAEKVLDQEGVSDVLRQASAPQLARALVQAVEQMQFREMKSLQEAPDGDDAQAIRDALEQLQSLWDQISVD